MRRGIPAFLSVVLASVALTALTLMPAPQALGSAAHSRPPGIAPSAWVPISKDFAAVVERPTRDPYTRDRRLPSAAGYFAVWRDGRWLRLDSVLQQPPIRRRSPTASVWMSIEPNLAFVIDQQRPAPALRGEEPVRAALGYFAIKRSGHWLRLDPLAQTALFRGPLRAPSTGNWIPVGTNLRFVIEQRMGERHVVPQGPGQLPSVLGYFMRKRGGHWLRLDSIT